VSGASLVVWAVVNAVCGLQAIAFATRPATPRVQRILGLVIAALAVPATWAFVVFVGEGAGRLSLAGPLCFDAFVCLMLVVDYAPGVEWRRPPRRPIQVPYLTLFFGSIVLMGLPMFDQSRALWLVTAACAAALLVAMGYAMRRGVG